VNEQSSSTLFVIGPHRSGTSAVARLINLCGLHLGQPDGLLPPSADNPRGYWENRWLVDFNDELLALFGENWRTAGPIEIDSLPETLRTKLNDRAMAWTGVMDQHGAWAAKDPRLCLTASFWLALKPEAPVILSVRHPAAAIASLMHRRGDAVPDRQQAHAIWRRHFVGALTSTAGRPRLVVDYDRLLDDPNQQLKRIVNWLQERLPGYLPPPGHESTALSHLDRGLNRHSDTQSDDDYCDETDIELYQALLENDQQRIDALLDACRPQLTTFTLDGLITQRFELQREVSRLTGQLNTSRLATSQVEHELTALERSRRYRAVKLLLAPIAFVKRLLRRHGGRPRFSILLREDDADPALIQTSIASVHAQSYPHWKLLNETEPDLAGAARDSFIVLLDAGDLLDREALHVTASRLTQDPQIDFIYADEDEIGPDGGFCNAFHKPEFSPEYLLSFNYLARFSAIRSELFKAAGGFRAGFGGERDYDLLLRVTERARRVERIPQVLYHARPTSQTEQDWTDQARKILMSATERRGEQATVSNGLCASTYRVCYAVDPLKRVTIIIPSSGDMRLLKPCLDSIECHTQHPRYEILVVLNGGAADATCATLDRLSVDRPLRFIEQALPFNYSKINNHAAGLTDSPYLLFLNDDMRVLNNGWLTAMLEYAQLPEVGAVGAKLLYPNGTIQHAGILMGVMGISEHGHRGLPADQPGYFGQASTIKNCSAVTGACLLTRRELFDQIHGFNEELAVTCNDLDLCFKLRAVGKRIVYTPYARLEHYESQTRGIDDTRARQTRARGEVLRMWQIWGEQIDNDPYYNPNLTHWKEDFSLSTPWDKRLREDYMRNLRQESLAQP
jgi:GT2 family glycosyltransferase